MLPKKVVRFNGFDSPNVPSEIEEETTMSELMNPEVSSETSELDEGMMTYNFRPVVSDRSSAADPSKSRAATPVPC